MQRQKYSPTFYKLKDNGTRAMNFETARIHFLRDSFRHRRCLRCLSYLKTLLINLRYHCRQLLLLTFYWIKKGSKEKKLVECTFIVVSANVRKSLSNTAFFITFILSGTQDSALNWKKKRKNGNNSFKRNKFWMSKKATGVSILLHKKRASEWGSLRSQVLFIRRSYPSYPGRTNLSGVIHRGRRLTPSSICIILHILLTLTQ